MVTWQHFNRRTHRPLSHTRACAARERNKGKVSVRFSCVQSRVPRQVLPDTRNLGGLGGSLRFKADRDSPAGSRSPRALLRSDQEPQQLAQCVRVCIF